MIWQPCERRLVFSGMDLQSLKSWLDAYGRAWETGKSEAAGLLFTEDTSYQESPYAGPMRGRLAIVEYWSHVPRTQEDIHFNQEITALTSDIAVVH